MMQVAISVAERMGHSEWVNDPRFIKAADRNDNRAELQIVMEAVLMTETISYWMKKFGG